MPRGRPRKDLLLRSAELAGWALGGLEREIAETKERLSHLMGQAADLRSRLGKSSPAADEPAKAGKRGRPKRRTMSPAARKAISDKMKKRWAERKRLLEKAAKKE